MVANAIRYLALAAAVFALGGCSSDAQRLRQSGLASSGQWAPEWGWRCWSRFEVEGETVTILRDFEASGTINPYLIQSYDHEPHGTYWMIDPRPDGPPANEPDNGRKGRSEAEVLRDGPDYVHINYAWHTQVVGPVQVSFRGDGVPVGSQRLFSAREVRRSTGKDGKMFGLSGGLSKGPILQALYRTQSWAFSVTDATGKELVTGAFHPPDLARAVEEYRRVRAEIEALETEFRTDFQERKRGMTSCVAHESPEATI